MRVMRARSFIIKIFFGYDTVSRTQQKFLYLITGRGVRAGRGWGRATRPRNILEPTLRANVTMDVDGTKQNI